MNGCRCFSAWALWLMLACASMGPASAAATATATAPEDASAVRAVEMEVASLKRDADGSKTSDQRQALVRRAKAVLGQADALQSRLAQPIDQVEQRIAQLGPNAATSTDAAIRAQYLELNGELAGHVALSRRAALSEVDASQTLSRLTEAQAVAFSAELLQREASPLAPSLWRDGIAALRADLGNAPASGTDPTRVPRPWPLLLVALGGLAAISWALIRPGRRALDRVGARLAGQVSARSAGFSRALFAVWCVLVDVAVPAVVALLAILLIAWASLPALAAQAAASLLTAVVVGLYVRATAVALLQPARPEWRLWPLDDRAAAQVAGAGHAVALAMALVIAVEAFVELLQLSRPAQVLVHSVLACVSTVILAYALYRLDRLRRLDDHEARGAQQPSRGPLVLWVGLGWLAVTLLALLGVLGYVTLANRMTQWAVWGGVVAFTTVILMAFVDGLCSLLANARTSGSVAAHLPLQQAAVILSAVCRLLLLALACGALLVPFGAGFTSVLELLSPLATGFDVGGVTISAAAVLRAILAFVVVLLLVRGLRGWINRSYFPTTGLQADARDSIDKILRYLGMVLAILWALTAFGVSMDKVAILASALSVGIGFGLQAITQNFVSGLILLVERPVRIGDWIKVNDVEGDIRRINVRSTEIRVADHSTVIVPNSELITKVVQNKTIGSSLGRAQILLSIPLEAELGEAIDAIESTLAADADVLDDPAPGVFIDRIEGGMAVLNCLVHVKSPRIAYRVRSRLILAVLGSLRARGLPVALPPQQFVLSPSAPA